MDLPGWMVLLVAPAIGSWLGVLVRRWPQGREMVVARSACEHCGHVLAPYDLIPVVSFFWLRGKCRYCSTRIDPFHPAIELAALSIALAAFFTDGGGLQLWIDASLGWALLCAAWIDAETMRLPDILTLPLVLAGLAVTRLYAPAAIYDHAAAAALGYLGFRLLDLVYLRLRHRQGLGEGDAKLLAAAGAWLGLEALPYVIMGAGLLGILVALLAARRGGFGREQQIAFGPALALAFYMWRLFGSHFSIPV